MNTWKFVFDGKEKTIRQKTNSAYWWMREKIDGKLKRITFPTCHRADAERMARDYLRGRREGKGQELRELLRQRKPIQPSPTTPIGPSIGEILEAYKAAPQGPLERTRRENITCLRSIIQRVLGPELEWTHRPLSALTKDLVRGYKNIVAESAKKEGLSRAETGRRQRSANSTLRQARSIFCEAMLEHYEVDCKFNLNLTTLREFKNSPHFLGLPRPNYNEPPDNIQAAMIQALERGIRQKDLDVYLACWLAMTFGLRKSEVAPLTTDCFIRVDGEMHVEIRMVEGRGALRDQTKNGQVAPRVKETNNGWAYIGPIIEQMPRGRYVLSGSDTERTDRVFRRANAWLKAQGFHTQKKFHELRALAGSRVIMNDGIEAASGWLRHGSISTTQAYYGRYAKTSVSNIPLPFTALASRSAEATSFGTLGSPSDTPLDTPNCATSKGMGHHNNGYPSTQTGVGSPAQNAEDKAVIDRKLLE